jgi:hypothetical protein
MNILFYSSNTVQNTGAIIAFAIVAGVGGLGLFLVLRFVRSAKAVLGILFSIASIMTGVIGLSVSLGEMHDTHYNQAKTYVSFHEQALKVYGMDLNQRSMTDLADGDEVETNIFDDRTNETEHNPIVYFGKLTTASKANQIIKIQLVRVNKIYELVLSDNDRTKLVPLPTEKG